MRQISFKNNVNYVFKSCFSFIFWCFHLHPTLLSIFVISNNLKRYLYYDGDGKYFGNHQVDEPSLLVNFELVQWNKFHRWQDKLKFILTVLKIFYVLDPSLEPIFDTTDEDSEEVLAERKKE